MTEPWLSIVGIGEDGLDGLSLGARAAIAGATLVFGGERHLALMAPIIAGETRAWQSPFSTSIEEVLAAKDRKVCVLASGDPFHYGVGATLSRQIDPAQMQVFPQPSAFSLAAARLGWPLQEVVSLSLHGRPIDLIRPHLHPAARTARADGACRTCRAECVRASHRQLSRSRSRTPGSGHHVLVRHAGNSGNMRIRDPRRGRRSTATVRRDACAQRRPSSSRRPMRAHGGQGCPSACRQEVGP